APAFAARIGFAFEEDIAEFVGDGKALAIGLAVASAIWPGLRSKVGTDRAFAEFSTKNLEIVSLVTSGQRLKVMIEDRSVELIVCPTSGVGIDFRPPLP